MSDSTTQRSTRVLSLRAWGGGFMGGPCRVAGSAPLFEQRARSTVSSAERYDLPSTSVSAPHDTACAAEGDSNRSTEAGSQSCRAHLCTHSLFTGIGGRLCSMGEKWQRHIVLTTLTPASLNNGCEQTKPVRTSLFKVRPTWACRETARPNHRPHSSRAISSACIALIARRNTSRANVLPAAVSLLPVSPVVAGFPAPRSVRAGVFFLELLSRICCIHQQRFVAAQYGLHARVVSITA
jgi:hypothetical protein